MKKKNIPDIYPDLPTDISEVEKLLDAKVAQRAVVYDTWIASGTELGDLDLEIKHLKRQAGFILGLEEPQPGEIERLEAREKREKIIEKMNKGSKKGSSK